jgi:murein DD-endopeptidase MepM/ murein hydrolase activator NlpD
MVTITKSVGLEGVNVAADARAVQALLNQNRSRISGAREIAADGIVGPRTIELITSFQTEVMRWHKPDGLVEPDGKTLKALNGGARPAVPGAHADPVPPPAKGPPLDKPICFPLRARPAADYHYPASRKEWHHRYFGAPRKDSNGNFRAHAGVDLIGAPETPIMAIDDGIVESYSHHFFDITGALVVNHANGLTIRYGETSHAAPGLKANSPVKRGQVIAFIGRNTKGTAMLHIEFYAGTARGALSMHGNLFQRRGDLINPTSYLDNANVESARG